MLYTVNGVIKHKEKSKKIARSLAGKFIGGRATKVRPPTKQKAGGLFRLAKMPLGVRGGGAALHALLTAIYMYSRDLHKIICMAPPMSRLVCAARLRAPPYFQNLDPPMITIIIIFIITFTHCNRYH